MLCKSIKSRLKNDIKKSKNLFSLAQRFGDVAQLARALDWQSRGRGFESHLLHLKTEGLQRCGPFFVSSLAHYLHTSPIKE